MTPDEWAMFLMQLNASFRGDKVLSDPDDPAASAREAIWRGDIGGEPYERAQAALRLLRQDGQAMMPAPGEMIVAMRRVSSPASPSWLEAWPVIRRVLMKRNRAELAEGLPEPLRSFTLTYGVDRLAREEVEDPDHGGAVLARLGRSYGEFVESFEDGTRVALARGEGGPRRLDPVAALGYVARVPDEGAQADA